jgi:hypothetical protein
MWRARFGRGFEPLMRQTTKLMNKLITSAAERSVHKIFCIFISHKSIWKFVMFCYVKLCYAMLCYAMLCYAMLCYVMLWYVRLLSEARVISHVSSQNFRYVLFRFSSDRFGCMYAGRTTYQIEAHAVQSFSLTNTVEILKS